MRKISVLALSALLTACAVGPDYKAPPAIEVGAQYKASHQDWVQISEDSLGKEDWWLRFKDDTLNRLMQELNQSNFQLAEALATYEAALASVRSSRAGLFPNLGTSADYTRSGGDNQNGVSNTYQATGSLSWEVDLWGKVRRQVEASKNAAQASEADVANLRLSLQAQLAKAYFSLRMTDEQIALLNRIVASYEKAVQVNQNRYDQGVAARADVVSAMAQLENARAQAINIQSTRQQYESTIAVLLGKAPSQVTIPQDAFVMTIPSIPTVLPASLLWHRADIYSAERAVAKANEEIGVAQAAWFPSLNLGVNGGLSQNTLANWLSAPLSFWSLGPALALTIFDGGARSAVVASSTAQYQGKVAAYRQTVLNALKEVEDNMTLLNTLNRQHTVQQRALAAARESLKITRNQYQAGLVNYLSVTQVENTAYNTEISALQLMNQRLNAAVDLIMAFGGGWQVPTTQTQ